MSAAGRRFGGSGIDDPIAVHMILSTGLAAAGALHPMLRVIILIVLVVMGLHSGSCLADRANMPVAVGVLLVGTSKVMAFLGGLDDLVALTADLPVVLTVGAPLVGRGAGVVQLYSVCILANLAGLSLGVVLIVIDPIAIFVDIIVTLGAAGALVPVVGYIILPFRSIIVDRLVLGLTALALINVGVAIVHQLISMNSIAGLSAAGARMPVVCLIGLPLGAILMLMDTDELCRVYTFSFSLSSCNTQQTHLLRSVNIHKFGNKNIIIAKLYNLFLFTIPIKGMTPFVVRSIRSRIHNALVTSGSQNIITINTRLRGAIEECHLETNRCALSSKCRVFQCQLFCVRKICHSRK